MARLADAASRRSWSAPLHVTTLDKVPVQVSASRPEAVQQLVDEGRC